MIYGTIEPCKKKKGFEAIPNKFLKISLEELKRELLSNLKTFRLLRETKFMIVLADDKQDFKIAIFPSCRVFVHGDIPEYEAQRVIQEISKSVEKITSS